MMSVQGGAASGAFKVNSLSNLDTADPVAGRIVWDAPRSLWNMGMLAGALILGPLTFNWRALVAFLIQSGVTLGVGQLGRLSSPAHPSQLECPLWLERSMIRPDRHDCRDGHFRSDGASQRYQD